MTVPRGVPFQGPDGGEATPRTLDADFLIALLQTTTTPFTLCCSIIEMPASYSAGMFCY